MVVDPEHGLIDSPLVPSQVVIFPWVPDALRRLQDFGYRLVIATNQPSWAKGKTTHDNLLKTHERVVRDIQVNGAFIRGSYICFHRREDGCACRKPATGLIEAAFTEHTGFDKRSSWMVGDGITDVQAGASFGINTAFLGPRKCDACKILNESSLAPTYWGSSLREFVDFLLEEKHG